MKATVRNRELAVNDGEGYPIRVTSKQQRRARKKLNRMLRSDVRRTLARDGYVDIDECPNHGFQVVTGHGSTGPAHDPYGACKLACGDWVVSFGPGDSNHITTAVKDDALARYE